MDNVFINCPYDEQYLDFFKFAIYFCCFLGLNPVFASESESSDKRMTNILDGIKGSKYSIHDISRNEMGKAPRFNMPFELGIDYCYKEFVDNNKKMLVMSKVDYDADKTLSDSKCLEVKYHNDSFNKYVETIRDFFVGTLGLANCPSVNKIIDTYKTSFDEWLSSNCKCVGFENSKLLKASEFKLKSLTFFKTFPNYLYDGKREFIISENLI